MPLPGAAPNWKGSEGPFNRVHESKLVDGPTIHRAQTKDVCTSSTKNTGSGILQLVVLYDKYFLSQNINQKCRSGLRTCSGLRGHSQRGPLPPALCPGPSKRGPSRVTAARRSVRGGARQPLSDTPPLARRTAVDAPLSSASSVEELSALFYRS